MFPLRFWIVLLGLTLHIPLPLAHAGQIHPPPDPRSTGAGIAIEGTEPDAKPALEPSFLDGERVVLRVTMEATDVGGSSSEIGSAGSAGATPVAASRLFGLGEQFRSQPARLLVTRHETDQRFVCDTARQPRRPLQ